MNLKDSISYSFIQIANLLRSNLEKLLADTEPHSGQILVLESLWENDCQSQADPVRNLSVTAPTIYNLVIRLSAKGFVEMKKCTADNRIMRICLTQKGIDVRPIIEDCVEKLEKSIFVNLSETERAVLFC